MPEDKKTETVEDRSEPETAKVAESGEKAEGSGSSTPTDSSEAVSSSTGGLKVENRTAEPEGRSTGELVISELRQIQVGETRALSNSSASAISPPELTTFVFDKLRASSVALQSGIPVETTDRQSVTWPRLTTDTTPAFYSEGGTITAGDPVFDQVDVAPAKIAHRVIVSNELLDDSDPPVFQALSDNVTSTLGLKLDATVYQGGTALPGFTGMGNLAGKQTGGTITTGGVAGTASYSQLMAGVGLLRGANVPGPYVLAAHPDVGVAFQRLQDTTGQPLQPPPEAPAGYWSTQLAGTAYLYSPAAFRILTRQDATIELDRSRRFDSDESEVRGKLRAALVAPYENAIVTLTAT